MNRPEKPLGQKAYGSIPHLPNSRVGPGDHSVSPGQARIATEELRDRHDYVIVQEKLDGSCTAVAKVCGQILALGRAGYLAETSPYEMHRLFALWVKCNEKRFDAALQEGERLVGEWLAQAHGTIYDLPHEPWVAFDLMVGTERAPFADFLRRVLKGGFTHPRTLDEGPMAYPVERALEAIQVSGHGAVDPVEGAVWRVERKGKVEFLTKFVRPDKVDGLYLPEISGKDPIWNWQPPCWGHPLKLAQIQLLAVQDHGDGHRIAPLAPVEPSTPSGAALPGRTVWRGTPDDQVVPLAGASDAAIRRLLADLSTSTWLRAAIESAMLRDPVDAARDAYQAHLVLHQWCEEVLARKGGAL